MELIVLLPAIVAILWRLTYDTAYAAGRKYGSATHFLNIRGTNQALIVNREAFHDMRISKMELKDAGYDWFDDHFARHQSVYEWRGMPNVAT